MSHILVQFPYVPKGVTINIDMTSPGYDLFDWLEDLPRISKSLRKMPWWERWFRTVFNRPVHT